MGKIGRHNYEAFFLDYLEGALSDAERIEVQDFLIANPDLKEELDSFELVELNSETGAPIYFEKENLKRESKTGLLESDYLMIAEVEGVNSKEEKQRLSEIIKEDQTILSDLALFHKTKLKDSNSITYKDKEALKRKPFVFINLKKVFSYSSAAAAVIFAFIYFNQVDNRYTPISNSNSIAWKLNETEGEASTLFAAFEKQDLPVVSSTKKESKVIERTERRQIEKVELLESSKYAALNSGKFNAKPKNIDFMVDTNPIDIAFKENQTTAKDTQEEYTPIDEYAKNQIQDKLLKGKSISENINDGLAALSDDKVSFDIQTSDENKIQKFALNIGKFSFSRTN